MAYTILNVGVGHFILAFVWVICVILCIVVSRTHNDQRGQLFGPAFLLVAALITLILWVIPREDIQQAEQDFRVIYDQAIIGRTVLISFLALVLLVGIALYFMDNVMMPIYAKPLKKYKT